MGSVTYGGFGSESSFPGLDSRQPVCSLTDLDRSGTVQGIPITQPVVCTIAPAPDGVARFVGACVIATS